MFISLLFSCSYVAAAILNDGQATTRIDISLDREIITELVVEIQQLRNERDADREIIQNLEKRMAALNEKVLSLQNVVADNVDERGQENGQTRIITVKSDRYFKEKLLQTEMQKNVNTKRLSAEQPIAFTAYLQHELDHVANNQIVVFDTIGVNTNNVYDVATGVFTAPLSGLYVISTTILSGHDREIWCGIMVNGHVKAQINERGTEGRHGAGSQTLVFHLNQGDQVAIKNEHADDSVWGQLYTTFSGYLLSVDDTIETVVG